jgi:hypothetical protein
MCSTNFMRTCRVLCYFLPSSNAKVRAKCILRGNLLNGDFPLQVAPFATFSIHCISNGCDCEIPFGERTRSHPPPLPLEVFEPRCACHQVDYHVISDDRHVDDKREESCRSFTSIRGCLHVSESPYESP